MSTSTRVVHKPPTGKLDQKKFNSYWKKYVESIEERDNFAKGHLKFLEILCDLLVEYDNLQSCICRLYEENKNKYSYFSEGRYGIQLKPFPEIKQRNDIIKDIRAYAKLLDLVLTPDKTQRDDDEDEWS